MRHPSSENGTLSDLYRSLFFGIWEAPAPSSLSPPTLARELKNVELGEGESGGGGGGRSLRTKGGGEGKRRVSAVEGRGKTRRDF